MMKTTVHSLSFVLAAAVSSTALAGSLGLGLGGHAGGQIGAISSAATRIQPVAATASQHGATGAQVAVGVDVKAGHGNTGHGNTVFKHGELAGGVAQGTAAAGTVAEQVGSAGTSAGSEAGATGSAVTDQASLPDPSATAKADGAAGIAARQGEPKKADKKARSKHGHEGDHGKAAPSTKLKGGAQAEAKAGVQAS